MNNTLQFIVRIARHSRRLNRILTVVASAVVLCTAYILMQPAITAEGGLICDFEEHTHSDQCYETVIKYEPVLVCTLPEMTEHEHDETCYDIDGNLICEVQPHQHDESCYIMEETEVTQLVCELPEHTHTDECFDIKPMTLESDGTYEHIHTEDCYRADELVCTLDEPEEEPEPFICERAGTEFDPYLPEDYADGITVEIPDEVRMLLESGSIFENTDTVSFKLILNNRYPFVGESWFAYPFPYDVLASDGEPVSLNTAMQPLYAGRTEIGEWCFRDDEILCCFDAVSDTIYPVSLELTINLTDPAPKPSEDNASADDFMAADEFIFETAEEIVEAPTEEATEEIVEAPTEEATEEIVEAPTEEAAKEIVEAPTEEAAEEIVEAPTEEATEEIVEAPTEEATEEIVEAPTEEAAVEVTAVEMSAAKSPARMLKSARGNDGSAENPFTVEDYGGTVVVSLLEDAEERLLSGDPFQGDPHFSFRLQVDNSGTYMVNSWFEYLIPFDWENNPRASLSCIASDYNIKANGVIIGTWELTKTSLRCYFNENAQSYNYVHMLFTLTLTSGDDYGQEFDMKRPFVIVQKLDAYTREPMAGVTFALFDENGVELAREVTDEKGIAAFYEIANDTYLAFYKPYYIQEMYDTELPEYLSGYARDNSERWFVSTGDEIPPVWQSTYERIITEHPGIDRITQSNREKYVNGSELFEILNYPYYSLPETGGVGALVCYVSGITILTAALIVWKCKKESITPPPRFSPKKLK